MNSSNSSTTAQQQIDDNNKIIAANLKKWRETHQPKLSQTDIGNVIGRTFQAVQKIESGNTNITAGALLEIARTFDVPLYTFFGIHKDLPNHPTQDKETQLLSILEELIDQRIKKNINQNNTTTHEAA